MQNKKDSSKPVWLSAFSVPLPPKNFHRRELETSLNEGLNESVLNQRFLFKTPDI